MSAFLELRDAIVSLLMQAPAVAGGHVIPGRAHPLPEGQPQGVYVRIRRNTGRQPFAGDSRTDWSTTLLVVCMARGTTDGDAAADALLAAVYARLATSNPPPQADGWVINPQIDWDVEEAEVPIGAAALQVTVQHRTASGELTAAA